MAEGRNRADWDRTAATLATIVNANPFRAGQPIHPRQLNPYRAREPEAPPPVLPMAIVLNAILVGQGNAPSIPVSAIGNGRDQAG